MSVQRINICDKRIFQTDGFEIWLKVDSTHDTDDEIYSSYREVDAQFYYKKTDNNFGNTYNRIYFSAKFHKEDIDESSFAFDYDTTTNNTVITSNEHKQNKTICCGLDGNYVFKVGIWVKTSEWITNNGVTNLTPQQLTDLQNDIIYNDTIILPKNTTYINPEINRYNVVGFGHYSTYCAMQSRIGNHIYTIDNAIFDNHINLRTFNLDTTLYDYDLQYCFDTSVDNVPYPSGNTYYTTWQTAVTKGNIVNGDNDIVIPYPQYATTVDNDVALKLTQYEKNSNTIIMESWRVFTFTQVSNVTLSNFSFYDYTHDSISNEFQPMYDNTFNAYRDFISNVSFLNVNFRASSLSSNIIPKKVQITMDNQVYSVDYSNNNSEVINVVVALGKINFDFSEWKQLAPERVVKKIKVNVTFVNRVNGIVSNKYTYCYIPLISHYHGRFNYTNIYRCNCIGVEDHDGDYISCSYSFDYLPSPLNSDDFTTSLLELYFKVNGVEDNTLNTHINSYDTSLQINERYTSRLDDFELIPCTPLTSYECKFYFKNTFVDSIFSISYITTSRPIMNFRANGYSMAIGGVAQFDDTLDIGYDVVKRGKDEYNGFTNVERWNEAFYDNSFSSNKIDLNDDHDYSYNNGSYQDSNNRTIYPHGYKIEHCAPTDKPTINIRDMARGNKIVYSYTSHDEITDTSRGSTHEKNYNFGGMMATPLYFNADLNNNVNSRTIYDYQSGARVITDISDLRAIVNVILGQSLVASLDSGAIYKWGCVCQMFLNFVVDSRGIGSGDIGNVGVAQINQNIASNFIPLMTTSLTGGHNGSLSTGIINNGGKIYFCSTSDSMSSGSLVSCGATFLTRFDNIEDHYII